jgi:hypothetical protein
VLEANEPLEDFVLIAKPYRRQDLIQGLQRVSAGVWWPGPAGRSQDIEAARNSKRDVALGAGRPCQRARPSFRGRTTRALRGCTRLGLIVIEHDLRRLRVRLAGKDIAGGERHFRRSGRDRPMGSDARTPALAAGCLDTRDSTACGFEVGKQCTHVFGS